LKLNGWPNSIGIVNWTNIWTIPGARNAEPKLKTDGEQQYAATNSAADGSKILMSDTAIKKLEAQEISFIAEMDMVEEIEKKWSDIPDASDKKGDELCRAGAREAQQLRKQITEKGNEIKKRVNDFKTDLDDFVGGLTERLKTKEDALRAEYRRVEDEKKRERERQAKLEQERIARLRQRIFEITQLGIVPYGSSIDDINKRIDAARETEVSKDEFGDFFAEAHQSRESVLVALNGIFDAEVARAEKERLEEEERAKIKAEQKAEREEQARIIREHEEKMRAEREAFEQEQREREEAVRKEREEREREEAAAKAEEAERNRIEREAENARRAEEQRIEREKREAEEERIAEERRRVEQERAKVEAEKAEQARMKADKEARAREEEERRLNAEININNRDEIIMAIMEKFDEEYGKDKEKWFGDIALCIADAIIAGEIPHVKYVGTEIDEPTSLSSGSFIDEMGE
jgi:hypothetical protein